MRQSQKLKRVWLEIAVRGLNDLGNQEYNRTGKWKLLLRIPEWVIENCSWEFFGRGAKSFQHPMLRSPKTTPPFLTFCFVHLVSVLEYFYVTILAARSMCLARNFSRLQNARPSRTFSLAYRCITEPVAFHVKHSRTEVGSSSQFLHNSKLSVDRPANSWDTIVVRRERPSET